MYKVEVCADNEFSYKIKSKDYEFCIDGKGKCITPPDTLLASLGSCIAVYMHKYAQGSGVNLGNFRIVLDAEFTKEAPVCFNTINVLIDLKGISLDERRKNALLGFIKNCPVHNTLKADPTIEIKIA